MACAATPRCDGPLLPGARLILSVISHVISNPVPSALGLDQSWTGREAASADELLT